MDVYALRDITMSSNPGTRTERSITASGNVRLEAGGTLALGAITATGKNVALIAATGITDGLLFDGVKFEKDCTRDSVSRVNQCKSPACISSPFKIICLCENAVFHCLRCAFRVEAIHII